MNEKIQFLALGGQDERGKNCYIIEYNNEIYIFNIGVKMPIDSALGVSMITVGSEYLYENGNKIKGIFIGTASCFNIGGLQFLLNSVGVNNIPVFTSRVGKTIIDSYVEKKKKLNRKIVPVNTIAVNPLKPIEEIKSLQVIPFRTSNYLPESLGWCFNTELGSIVFIDDFFVNSNKTNAFLSQINLLPSIVQKNNVLALIVGIGNVGVFDGYTAPNYKTEAFYEGVINSTNKRVIVALNDYNAYSILVLAAIAREHNRPFIIYSSTFINTFNTLVKNKMFNPKNLRTLPISAINSTDNAIVVISDTEEDLYKKLFLIADNQISTITFNETDTFVLGTHLVPGYELHGARLLDSLSKKKLRLYTLPKTTLNLKASNEDHKFLVDLLKPKNIIPIEGYYMSFIKYQELIQKYNKQVNIHFLDNKDVITFYNNQKYEIETNKINNLTEKYISTVGVLDTQASVLLERKQMSTSGIVLINLFASKENQQIYTQYDLKTLGIVIKEKDNLLLLGLKEKMEALLIKSIVYKDNKIDLNTSKNNIKKNILRYFEKKANKKPLVLPTIIEI